MRNRQAQLETKWCYRDDLSVAAAQEPSQNPAVPEYSEQSLELTPAQIVLLRDLFELLDRWDREEIKYGNQ